MPDAAAALPFVLGLLAAWSVSWRLPPAAIVPVPAPAPVPLRRSRR